MTRWLLVGATDAETLPVLRAIGGARPLAPRLMAGSLAGAPVAVLTAGVGPGKAARFLGASVARFRPDRVVSFGTCGGLVPGLAVGDLRTVDPLYRAGSVWEAEPLPGHRVAGLATVDRFVWSREQREALVALGAAICDMEAAVVAQAAHEAGLRFSALKVVSDKAGAEPDPALPRGRLSPLTAARFKLRAMRLVARRLLPALREALADRPERGLR